MTTLNCPHCGEAIELLGQKELSEEFSMGPNPVAHARSLGIFPIPVLSFGNRNMWLRGDIEAYVADKNRERIAKLVGEFEETIAGLPENQQKQAREMLLASDSKLSKRK